MKYLIRARPQVPSDVQRPIQGPHVPPADLSLDPLPVEDVEAAVTAVAHCLGELVPLVDDDLGVDNSAISIILEFFFNPGTYSLVF